ncbi:MAG: chemotaxis protein CheR [Spirochaetales bacterium]|nr:chemotaxis protein CheR [Spirochaetales bacterium]
MSDEVFRRLASYIHENLGIKMPRSKHLMLQSRVHKRLKALGLGGYEEYCAFFFSPRGQEEELDHLFDVATTNKTEFFREPVHFDILTRTVLPAIRAERELTASRPLVVWSAGCSTGEEPYSLAMSISEYASAGTTFPFLVLASDISTRALETARLAVYSEAAIRTVPVTLRAKYLLRSKDREKNEFRIVPALRAAVRFFRLNLMEKSFDLPVRPDVIFCRNVVIYFDRATQTRLFRRFAESMARGGYLFTGHSENLCNMGVPFASVLPTVYRSIDGTSEDA